MFKITHYDVSCDKIPREFDGYKIVQISDLHNRNWKGKLVRAIDEQKPDILLLTGDLINSYHPDLKEALSFVQRVRKIAPLYMVSGNHESRVGCMEVLQRYTDGESFQILDNRRFTLEREGAQISLLGIRDPDFSKEGTAREQREILKKEIQGIKGKEGEFQILLSHRPEHFLLYVEEQIDLVFCGHAHGGQFRFPFTQGLYAPHQGIFPKYTAGLHQKGSTQMVVSRGLADSSFPIRINNPFELVTVTLKYLS